MFVKVKDFHSDRPAIVRLDNIIAITESPVYENCRDIFFKDSPDIQVRDSIDDLMALLEESK